MSKPRLLGKITLRGDKSLSHRLLMFAALANGTSEIRNLSDGADVASTLQVLQRLGIQAERSNDVLRIIGKGLHGFHLSDQNLDCGNSGTTLRLFLGILAGSHVACTLSGDASLNRRPVKRVIRPLCQMGADLHTAGDADCPPVIVSGRPLHGIAYDSTVASAQVKSAVLFAALNAEGEMLYREPTLSRDHTERFLEWQQVNIKSSSKGIRLSPPALLYPFDYYIPGDISTAVYFIVAATIMRGSELVVENVLLNPTRTGALDILKDMGADIVINNQRMCNNEVVGDIEVRAAELHGFDASAYNAVQFIDEVPILAVAAAFANGVTTFEGLDELRIKETDRLQGMADILGSYGCVAQQQGSRLTVTGGVRPRLQPSDHFGDHRLAMAIEILELLTTGSVGGSYQECIAISAPDFYHTLQAIMK